MDKNLTFQPIIKWSGSKRKIASHIEKMIPMDFSTYYEPFVGGGSMLYAVKSKNKIASDINKPLIELWNMIKQYPEILIETYSKYWHLLNEENNPDAYKTFYEVRDRFNSTFQPEDLFFLSRTCVNGLIRFNKQGQFNNSLHYTRKGIEPKKLEKIVYQWVDKIKDTQFLNIDYSEILNMVQKNDFVYLDPPYFNTKGMYYGSIDNLSFLNFLEQLNSKGVRYLLSFDGKTCSKDYTFDLPKELFERHEYIFSGKSTFKKIIDKESNLVYESLYLNY